jgi:uncharacterized protein (TIGR01777 family)
MNVLIAGGSGLIGRALTDRLLADQYHITIVSREPDTLREIPHGVLTTNWEKDSLVRSAAESDAIVNLAGASIASSNPLEMRWTNKRKSAILESRIRSGKKLSDAILESGTKPETLIQSSAIGYYGNTGQALVDETSSPGNDFLTEVCLPWEESTKQVEPLGVRRVIIRTGLVFSSDGGLYPLLKLPFILYFGGPIGTGQQYLSWIHIDDLVSGIQFLIENQSAQGVYNLTAPNPVQNSEFARLMSKIIQKPNWFTVPGFLLKIALGEAATLALDGRQVFPQRLLNAGFVFQYDQLEDALKDLEE